MDFDEGPIRRTKEKNGKPQRHCFTCNKLTHDFTYRIFDEEGNQLTYYQSLNKNKAWEKADEYDVVNDGHGRFREIKEENDRWRGYQHGDQSDPNETSPGGRQAKKLARQQKAKKSKTSEHKMTGGKQKQIKGDAKTEEKTSSEEEETSSDSEENSQDETKEKRQQMWIDEGGYTKRAKAVITCRTCSESKWRDKTDDHKIRQQAKDFSEPTLKHKNK